MNPNMKFVAIGIVAVLLVAGAGFAVYKAMETDDSGIKVTDSLGREVTVPEKVERIVCQQAGTLRLVSYFGAVDKVVGIDKGDGNKGFGLPENYNKATYRLAYPGIKDLTFVGQLDNVETVIAANPDVIIASDENVSTIDNFQKSTNIPVIAVDIMVEMNDMPRFEKVIRLVGKVLGMDARAEEMLNGINGLLGELATGKGKVKADEVKSAYIGAMFYYMKGGIYKTSGNYSAFDLTGVKNVMPDKNGIPYDTDDEGLKASNPDYIFFDPMRFGLDKIEFAKEKPKLTSAPAVANQMIYSTFIYKYYGTNWENQMLNMFWVGSVVYPDYFTFDAEKANQILNVFYGEGKLTYEQLIDGQRPGAPRQLTDW